MDGNVWMHCLLQKKKTADADGNSWISSFIIPNTKPAAQAQTTSGWHVLWASTWWWDWNKNVYSWTAADKRPELEISRSVQYVQGAINCTKAIKVSGGWSEKKEIPENGLDQFYCSDIKLPRLQTQPQYPSSWPSVTTWHSSNTCITGRNSHYIHLLGVQHATDSDSGQGKDLRVGKLTHPESATHTHRATLTTYLCYITHATAYPSSTRSALLSATKRYHRSSAKLLVPMPFLWLANSRTGSLGCWCNITPAAPCGINWDFSKLDFSKTWQLAIQEGECGQRICFESGPLIVARLSLASPLKDRVLEALLAWGDHRKICFIV